MAVNRPLTPNPELTGIAVAAPVPGMIADQVLPEVTVLSETYKWTEFGLDQGTTVPDTEVGRTAQVKRVEFGGVERDGSVKDYGLEDAVPATDQNANTTVKAEDLATEMTSQLVTLHRELRVRDVVFASASYLPAQVTTYGAGQGWYDPDINALEEIEEAKDASVVDFNTLTLGKDGWAALRRNPFMVKAARPANTSGEGRLSMDEVKDLLEIDTIIVGKAMVNAAKPGQDAQLKRAWASHASLSYVERVVKHTKVFTFGSTFRLTGKQTWSYFDPGVGLEGGNVIRVGERIREQIIAPQAGWLFLNAAAPPV